LLLKYNLLFTFLNAIFLYKYAEGTIMSNKATPYIINKNFIKSYMKQINFSYVNLSFQFFAK